jgi:hypothetical protein
MFELNYHSHSQELDQVTVAIPTFGSARNDALRASFPSLDTVATGCHVVQPLESSLIALIKFHN